MLNHQVECELNSEMAYFISQAGIRKSWYKLSWFANSSPVSWYWLEGHDLFLLFSVHHSWGSSSQSVRKAVGTGANAEGPNPLDVVAQYKPRRYRQMGWRVVALCQRSPLAKARIALCWCCSRRRPALWQCAVCSAQSRLQWSVSKEGQTKWSTPWKNTDVHIDASLYSNRTKLQAMHMQRGKRMRPSENTYFAGWMREGGGALPTSSVVRCWPRDRRTPALEDVFFSG
jgi:hypothetical protein